MKNHVSYITFLISLFTAFHINAAAAGDDAATLYFRHRYQAAIAALPTSPQTPEQRSLLGLCYLKLGLMNIEIHETFLPLALAYYKELDQLPERIGEDARPSVYTPYYLGLANLEGGDYEGGIEALKRYLDNPLPDEPDAAVENLELLHGAKEPAVDLSAYARCALGTCYALKGNQKLSEAEFKAVSKSIAEAPPQDKQAISVCLAAAYQRLGIHAERVRQIYQEVRQGDKSTPPLKQFYHRMGTIASHQGEHAAALQWIGKLPDNRRDFVSEIFEVDLDFDPEVPKVHRSEFFHPRVFIDVATVYLRYAYHLFSNLIAERPELAGDFRYANALILVQLGNYEEAKEILESLVRNSKADPVLFGCTQILLGTCDYRRGEQDAAKQLWKTVSTREPIIAIELASAYAKEQIEPMNCARLIREALDQIKKATKGEQITGSAPEFYPPADLFPQREVYRRAGKALLNLSQYASDEVATAELKMKAEERLVDLALQGYQLGHVIRSHSYVVDAPPHGNDPVLLINMAYASYLRGFIHWRLTMATFGTMIQEAGLQELYPLLFITQKIYHIRETLGTVTHE